MLQCIHSSLPSCNRSKCFSFTGNAVRFCISNQTWGRVDVTDCTSQEFEDLATNVSGAYIPNVLYFYLRA